MPKVSIITPTYNRSEVLPRAIESVQEQTLRDYEHIIIDDGSTDETPNLVASISDERIRYVRLKSNQGANVARNKGIEEASGEFISFLDSDDEYFPERLKATTSALDSAEEEYAGVVHAYEAVENGGVSHISRPPAREITIRDLADGNSIGGLSCTLFRRESIMEINGFDEVMPASQDYDLYLRVLHKYNIVGLNDVLSRYHHGGGGIQSNMDAKKQGQESVARKHSDVLTTRHKSRQSYSRGLVHGKAGNIRKARKEIRNAIFIYQKDPLYYYHYISTFGGKNGFDLGMEIKNRVGRLIDHL